MTYQIQTYYEICIAGHLGSSVSQLFEGLTARHVERDTILTGPIVDQAALYGVLIQLRDLGLSLISVNQMESTNDKSNK